VATNYCLNKLRDSRRLEFRKPEALPEPLSASNCEKWLSARQQLVALLSRVDKRTQAIVVYTHMDGMTQEEIASLMGLSRRTVGKKLSQFNKIVEELARRERVA
jgi:RNA polymerase sigma-70 factor (ECF subfamily)